MCVCVYLQVCMCVRVCVGMWECMYCVCFAWIIVIIYYFMCFMVVNGILVI